jgi:hypothetical protein
LTPLNLEPTTSQLEADIEKKVESNKEWIPEEKQKQVLSCPDSVFELLGGGSAGGGKTDLGVILPLARQFHEHPKFKALIMRRTFTDLEKEIVVRQHEWYAPAGGVYNETKKVWKWPWGARIQNGHAEREQDVRKYDSAEYNLEVWDEVTHFTGFQYLYLALSRCRSSSPDLPAIVRSFTNPGNAGHNFFKKRFVDPWPKGGRILKDKTTGLKRVYIPFLGRDNKWLIKNDPNYLLRLEGLPGPERRAKLFGDWNSYEGQVFSEFRILHIGGEPDFAVHTIKRFPIPDWWPRFLCIDWGWAAYTFAIWSAVSPDGRVYIYRCYAWNGPDVANSQKKTAKVWGRECNNLTGSEKIQDFVMCHSAAQHHGDEKTVRDQVSEAFDDRYAIELAPKDRIGGKNLVHEFLRWEKRPSLKRPETQYDAETAQAILRRKGEQAYQQYMSEFIAEAEELNLPKLQIMYEVGDKTPENLAAGILCDAIGSCVPSDKNPEDVAEFEGDDPYDALRMVCKTAVRYMELSSDLQERNNRMAKLIEQFKNSQDATAYYRAMEKMDKEVEDGVSCRRLSTVSRRYRVR